MYRIQNKKHWQVDALKKDEENKFYTIMLASNWKTY